MMEQEPWARVLRSTPYYASTEGPLPDDLILELPESSRLEVPESSRLEGE